MQKFLVLTLVIYLAFFIGAAHSLPITDSVRDKGRQVFEDLVGNLYGTLRAVLEQIKGTAAIFGTSNINLSI